MAFRCAKAVEAGLCTGGECCGIIPIEVAIYEKYRDQVTVPVTNVKVVGNYRLVETSDLLCAFYNRAAHVCSIYNDRPSICQLFGKMKELPCPYLKKNGKLRRPRDIVAIKRQQSEKVNASISNYIAYTNEGEPRG